MSDLSISDVPKIWWVKYATGGFAAICLVMVIVFPNRQFMSTTGDIVRTRRVGEKIYTEGTGEYQRKTRKFVFSLKIEYKANDIRYFLIQSAEQSTMHWKGGKQIKVYYDVRRPESAYLRMPIQYARFLTMASAFIFGVLTILLFLTGKGSKTPNDGL